MVGERIRAVMREALSREWLPNRGRTARAVLELCPRLQPALRSVSATCVRRIDSVVEAAG